MRFFRVGFRFGDAVGLGFGARFAVANAGFVSRVLRLYSRGSGGRHAADFAMAMELKKVSRNNLSSTIR